MYKQIKDKENITLDNVIVRIADGAFIPTDPANKDYQQYLEWIAQGNTPLPAEE